jgi:hypothetical protein
MPVSNADRQRAYRERQRQKQASLRVSEGQALRSTVTTPEGVTTVTEIACCPFCDPAKERTFGSAAAWFAERHPPAAIRGLIAALQRRLDANADPAPEIEIAWEAGAAARELTRLWMTPQLDMFRKHLGAGKPTRMTTVEKFILWGSDKAPKRIAIPDDPAAAAARLWLWWGTIPKKLHRLGREIARRTQVPPPPVPRCDDIPF